MALEKAKTRRMTNAGGIGGSALICPPKIQGTRHVTSCCSTKVVVFAWLVPTICSYIQVATTLFSLFNSWIFSSVPRYFADLVSFATSTALIAGLIFAATPSRGKPRSAPASRPRPPQPFLLSSTDRICNQYVRNTRFNTRNVLRC